MFFDALWIGLAIAAPVGPIGLLVIQRTLDHGRTLGFVTGLGAAVADALYGAVGAFGVTALIRALQSVRVPLAIVGGAFLLWLAWRTWRQVPATRAAQVAERPGLAGAFAGTLVLTLSNPATIFSFIAVFGALGARADAAAPGSAGVMIAGVFAGSALWWLLLSSVVAALRQRVPARALRVVNAVSAIGLAGFALWQWLGLLRA
ncbi:MAG: LysE family transporter [Burkholderiales bacterium]|nr:LysE family transporter [Burkholderiales bacterium]